MQHIRTKWHHIPPLIDEGNIYFTAPPDGKAYPFDHYGADPEPYRRLVALGNELPHFCIDNELRDLADNSTFRKSMLDMKRAGVLRFPYPAMVIEWEDSPKRHSMVLVRDLHYEEDLSWEDWSHEGMKAVRDGHDFYGIFSQITEDGQGWYACTSPAVIYINLQMPSVIIADQEAEIKITSIATTMLEESVGAVAATCDALVQATFRKDAGMVLSAAAMAYLMISTEGVARETISTDRINKKRKSTGKVKIPDHIYLKIGRVYRSDKSDVSDEYVPRRSPIPHYRRGYTRGVRYGPKRVNIKDMFFKPRLVAYKGPFTANPPPKMPEYIVTR